MKKDKTENGKGRKKIERELKRLAEEAKSLIGEELKNRGELLMFSYDDCVRQAKVACPVEPEFIPTQETAYFITDELVGAQRESTETRMCFSTPPYDGVSYGITARLEWAWNEDDGEEDSTFSWFLERFTEDGKTAEWFCDKWVE